MSSSTPKPPYPNPPIVEAVLAFHFVQVLPEKVLKRFAQQSKKRFPAQEQMLSFTIDTTSPLKSVPVQPRGFKLTNADSGRVIVFAPEAMSICRIGPYTHWEELIANAQETWADLKKVAGHPTLSRISTRYINRIDLKTLSAKPPTAEKPPSLALADYFNLGLIVPPAIVDMDLENFHVICTVNDRDNDLKCVLQLASGPSPLIGNIAFTLDIDVATTKPVPMREDDMWALAEVLRHRKNALFEASVTDKTRRLFA
jgi:uncharacterized protein (TIGR04255 family)